MKTNILKYTLYTCFFLWTATGDYVLCWYASGMTPIDYHQLEYRQVTASGSLEWEDQISSIEVGVDQTSGSPTPILNPYTGVSNLTSITPNTGSWLVRYRNIKSPNCIQFAANSSWSGLWNTEILVP